MITTSMKIKFVTALLSTIAAIIFVWCAKGPVFTTVAVLGFRFIATAVFAFLFYAWLFGSRNEY
jgi:hypothetical protein